MGETNRKAKALGPWEEIPLPIVIQALHDLYHLDPEEVLMPEEVLDVIAE